jgi:hypothetical protein
LAYKALASATLSIGLNPEFSAKTVGIYSKASAKALIAYYSTPAFKSADFFNKNNQNFNYYFINIIVYIKIIILLIIKLMNRQFRLILLHKQFYFF